MIILAKKELLMIWLRESEKKLREVDSTVEILTVWGYGYKIVD